MTLSPPSTKSSSRAITLTWDLDSQVIPNDWTRRSILRVETFLHEQLEQASPDLLRLMPPQAPVHQLCKRGRLFHRSRGRATVPGLVSDESFTEAVGPAVVA
jgi:hypothetical protein